MARRSSGPIGKLIKLDELQDINIQVYKVSWKEQMFLIIEISYLI